MVQSTLAAFCIVSSALISAQSATVVFPTVRSSSEGWDRQHFPLSTPMRYQQVEYQAKGRRFGLRAMEFRRDGAPSSAAHGRSVTVTIRVGATDGATFGNNFDHNWKSVPTTVVNAQTFHLPALSPPATPPARFLVKFPFTTMATHTGTDELLWEMISTPLSRPSEYVLDAENSSTTDANSQEIGLGCPSPWGSGRFSLASVFRANRAASELYYSMSGATPNSPGIVLLGTTNPNLQLPGVCTKLYSAPIATLRIGFADLQGTIRGRWISVGSWRASWARTKIYSQGVTLNPSQPTGLMLTQGRELTLPTRGPWVNVQSELYASSTTATTGFIRQSSGLVVRFP